MVRFRQIQQGIIGQINITPLTDTILVLLIIFMISGPGIFQSAFNINLPGSEYSESSQQTSAVIGLDSEGRLYRDGREIQQEQLLDWIAGLPDTEADRTFQLNADSATRHGQVIEVMDSLRDAGARRILVGTLPR